MNWSLAPASLGGWLATFSTFVLGLLMWQIQRKKGKVDESANILRAWKEMVEAHQSQIASMREDFTAYKISALAEIADLRKRLSANEREFSAYRKATEVRIHDLERENEGLKRAIAQNSQSTVWHLGKRATTEELELLAMRIEEETIQDPDIEDNNNNNV